MKNKTTIVMKISKHTYITLVLMSAFVVQLFAHVGPVDEKKKEQSAQYRFDCSASREEIDMDINNVRVRLQVGGDLFWDFDNGRYIVPKVDPGSGLDEVSSIFAGAVWLGGVLPGEVPSLKLACQDYRTTSGVDFYPGPLRDEDGTTDKERCQEWDRFFRVHGDSIRKHLANVERYQALGEEYPAAEVPEDLKRWPAIGNPFFNDYYDFELPDAEQGLGNFWNADEDPNYDPTKGDFPIIDIRGCVEPQFPDDMFFWIYNDAGNVHEVTENVPIRMEVQVQAFGYKTQDEINNMTFYRYKLINRAAEPIDSTFFAMWIDPDLGCSDDDFIGCDTAASLMYVYNQDAVDGINACECTVNGSITPTYCNDVPILGVDYFRGPLSEPRTPPGGGPPVRVDLGMTAFTYYNRPGAGNPDPGTTDPTQPIEYYRYLNGFWRDGTPVTYGGDGYRDGTVPVSYAFVDEPSNDAGWSMCTANLPRRDPRTMQVTGPFRLNPGDLNELIIGVVWLPEADYPCPSIEPLLRADQTAQALFDVCFEILDGPDAPTMCPLELDQEVIFTLVNDINASNNANLAYEQVDPKIKGLDVQDSTYNFEGYRIYQLAGADVSAVQANFEDVTKTREILSYDVKNDITTIYNWESVGNPFDAEPVWYPVEKVIGRNTGVPSSFSIKTDAFASGEDTRLINFKKYYFAVIAYAYNNYDSFDVANPSFGQRTAYIVGRNNVTEYTVVPRKTNHLNVNALYGEGLEVTRLDGNGVLDNTLIMSDSLREVIARNISVEEISWMPGGSPLNAKIYDPINVKDGEYILSFQDFEGDPELVTTKFTVESVGTGEIYESETTISMLNEELVNKFGFSVYFAQGPEPGTDPFNDESNGFLAGAAQYDDPDGSQWYNYIPEGASPAVNFIKTDAIDAPDYLIDPNQVYNTRHQTGFYPFLLCAYDTNFNYADPTNGFLYSPSWFDQGVGQIRRRLDATTDGFLSPLNNVDIVFTSDKELWSKCALVQTANYLFDDEIDEEYNGSMDLITRPSVTKESDPNDDNLPAEANDGTVGYAYFPGYAVDVETGKRVNIFFGENTFFEPGSPLNFPDSVMTGNDRMWNPPVYNPFYDNITAGCQHYIFVTDLEYDGCEAIHDTLLAAKDRPLAIERVYKQNIFKFVTWSGFPIMNLGEELLSYKDGLIPNDLTISLRVKNKFQQAVHTGSNEGFNQYRIKIQGKQSTELNVEEVESALDLINVVPNPYYAYSVYENSATDNIVKITNLPAECTISIYSLDGKFIRKYNRNVSGGTKGIANAPIPETLFATDVEWDLKNDNGIPIASGVYFIHVEAPGLGERVIKWFGVNRKFDPAAVN